MKYTLRVLGILVATLTVEDLGPTVIYNSGGTFEIAPEEPEEEYEYEEYEFGFKARGRP